MSDRADPAALAAGAEGDSVTAERLTSPVVETLATGEQPHHLLRGQSLDVSTDSDDDRVFPGVDAVVSLVATDRRVLVVVPKPIERRTNAVGYGDIERTEADTGRFKRFVIGTEDGSLGVNLPDDESPGPVAAFVRERAEGTSGDAAAGPASDAGDRSTGTGPRASGPADRGPAAGESGQSGAGPGRRATDNDSADSGPDPATPDGTADSRTVDAAAGSERGNGDSPGGVGRGGAGGDADGTSDSNDRNDAGAANDSSDGDTAGDGDADPLDRLERLADLHERGIVTDEEFEERKQELLDRL